MIYTVEAIAHTIHPVTLFNFLKLIRRNWFLKRLANLREISPLSKEESVKKGWITDCGLRIADLALEWIDQLITD